MTKKQIMYANYLENKRNNQEQSSLKRQENNIKQQEIELKRQELNDRNRIDLSLVEYETMKKKIENLTLENSYYQNVFEQLNLDEYLHQLDLNDITITTHDIIPANKKYVMLRIRVKDFIYE